jgi:hypothetical protein
MKKILLSLLLVLSLSPAIAQDASDLQAQIDNVADNLARDIANRWKWKGDLRFRNEDITTEFAPDRNRNRIRVRMGATAIVNDEIKGEVAFTTTENGDARSGNQTLSDVNSKKSFDLDLAYVEYVPNAYTKLVVGKQKYPWYKTSSYFFDNDVNPEGASLAFNHTSGLFGNVTLADLSERSTFTDSTMVAYQVGYRGKINSDTTYTVSYGYFDHRAVQSYSVIQSVGGGYFGNTTKTVGCLGGATTCLVNDYDVEILSAELSGRLLDRPLVVFADYAKNKKASLYNSATSYGFTLGKASLPGSYEIGYTYQKTGKDALFAQWVDSDFAGGNTDGKGHAIKGAYQIAKNWKFNTTYFVNKTNNNVATTVNGLSIKDRDYKRLQLDLNYSF